MDPDSYPGGPKTYGSGFGPATLDPTMNFKNVKLPLAAEDMEAVAARVLLSLGSGSSWPPGQRCVVVSPPLAAEDIEAAAARV
jgi:hypothetical protein